ncbi:histamine N-methyltransferase-like isoform X2 [Takifugu flavidus]|uniref:histamine N-methyltransferase-like isoform X2 n=1 Tax=Takifugu flavidus TaxID=433684 RepID=UPI002543FEBA|nr:histamine N-methyltransferase-like isoform X2 [Takifugu flavidus]
MMLAASGDPAMASSLRSLVLDDSRYQECFKLFLQRSTEHQCMQDFIHKELPAILASVGNGKAHLNVIGVGSGAGEIDLEILSELHSKHPGASVDNEVVEPSAQQLHKYKALVAQTPTLDYYQQMLYYVNDPEATVRFFQSLLSENGKLLVILVSGKSGWGKLWQTYKNQLCHTDISQCVTTGDIQSFLDSEGVRYQSFELPSQMDITECFSQGDEKGELLLDFLTEVLDFSKTAPPELRAGVLELLRHPDCSVETNGRVMFNNNLGVIVLDRLT